MNDNSLHAAHTRPPRPEFRMRGREMNRIEAVSDVVFGFALTLLVVSLQVPQTYGELTSAMRGFPAFAITFAVLMAVWARHYYFFRYYGLDDIITIVLNTVLLFVVLFYVYPLKFLCNIWLAPLTGMPMRITNAQGAMRLVMTSSDDTRGLQMIFGSGFAATYLVFAAMYWHAWRMRHLLQLSGFEIAHTRTSVVVEILQGAVGLLAMLAAYELNPRWAGSVGYIYLLVPVITLWRRHRRGRQRDLTPHPL
jgi:transmembrane protein TMEM174 (potassium channel)